MSAHCPGCHWNNMAKYEAHDPMENSWCPGCGHEAELAALRRVAEVALDDALTKIDRLKAAAAGHGMVSEMADMSEVAFLVVGLHERIALVEQERDALHADLDLQIKRTEEARNERDAALSKSTTFRLQYEQYERIVAALNAEKDAHHKEIRDFTWTVQKADDAFGKMKAVSYTHLTLPTNREV